MKAQRQWHAKAAVDARGQRRQRACGVAEAAQAGPGHEHRLGVGVRGPELGELGSAASALRSIIASRALLIVANTGENEEWDRGSSRVLRASSSRPSARNAIVRSSKSPASDVSWMTRSMSPLAHQV